MLGVQIAYLFICIQYYLVECSIATLKVNKLDRKLIARKRQDTLEMCRIFTEQNNKIEHMKQPHMLTKNPYEMQSKSRRGKRSVEIGKLSSGLNLQDAKRLESIVDKLYDEVTENGVRVTYRRKSFDGLDSSTNSNKDLENITSGRRFDFAPAMMLGPYAKPPIEKMKDYPNPDVQWHKKWEYGIVPYFIDSNTYDFHLAEIITKAFDYFERATCIRLQRLKDKPTDKKLLQNVEWLYITNPSGIRQCVHSNERKANVGVQMVIFGYDCMSLGEIVHEIMHVLGFSHEHTRSDRDQHITIMWDNIKPGYKKYFEIRPDDILMNFPYDYASVLHYPPRAFSKNGQVTIYVEPGTKLGQREGLSEGDVDKVGLIFGHECVKRNKQYLLLTCPSVVKSNTQTSNITKNEIIDYFKDRLWPYGVVNYKIRDKIEFSTEERENINTVIRHIEKETCIEFRDLSPKDDESESDEKNNQKLRNENSDTTTKKARDSENEINGDNSNNKISDTIEQDNEVNIKEKNDKADTTEKNDEAEITEKNSVAENRKESKEEQKSELRQGNLTQIQQATPSNRSANSVKSRRKRAAKLLPLRRHAENIIILTRSPDPGCPCPRPGRPNGNTELRINADCFNSVNDLLHLFVHVLGLDHQHNMHDRDSYLHILWDNLSPDVKAEMENKLPPAASVGFPYDYQSVTHFPWLQIKDGHTNIMYPIWNDGWAMGHWQGLSSIDVQKLNHLYYDECLTRKQKANIARLKN